MTLPSITTILFLSEYAGFLGGIEQYVFLTAHLLREAGYRVELFYRTPARDFTRYASAFHAVSCNLDELSPSPAIAMMHRLWDCELCKEILKRFGPHTAITVHDHDLYCPRRAFYTPFRRANCQRSYSTLRCGLCGSLVSPRHWPGKRPGALLRRNFVDFPALYRLAHQIPRLVVLSDFMRNNLVRNGFNEKAITVLPPAIRISEDCPLPDSSHFKNTPPLIGFVGQFLRGKGADIFLAVLHTLKTQGCTFQAVMLGDGPDRALLESLRQDYGLNVQMTGFVEHPETWYSKMDMLVFPFRWQEPFGLVGAEAAACAVPVIASNLGGVHSWMKDGETGLCVPPGDTAAFAEAARRLLQSPALCAQLGMNARHFAMETFSEQSFLNQFTSFLNATR